MKELKEKYRRRVENLTLAASLQKRRLQLSSISRIAVFVIIGLTGYWVLQGEQLYLVAVFLLIVLFAYLVSRHEDLKYEARRLRELIELNRTELRVLEGDFSGLPDGVSLQTPNHAFSEDLDLFGPRSFFQYLNRTGLSSGAKTLAEWLSSNQTRGIPEKQEAVQELASQMEWRQQFTATARMIETPLSAGELTAWMDSYQPRIPQWAAHLSLFFSVLSLGAGFAVAFGALPLEVLILLFFTGLLITLPYTKHIGNLAGTTGKMQETFRQFGRLVSQIETQSFQSSVLRQQQEPLTGGGKKVSAVLKRFNRLIGALDQRNNLLVAIFGNAFFLWDLRQAHAVENWIKDHGQETPGWFESLAWVDAFNSLANFGFNHPAFSYPLIAEDPTLIIEAKQLAHPLLFEDVVTNDLRIDKGHFAVITGANMAGKSTFLRSVALAIVMANTGLPVSARHMAYQPIPLISSMRTSDSLSRHESYFFAELKRLKMIVDHLEKGPYFVVLDEILKGTNSKDKARGSREFLERLLEMKATGLIATHDLSLCQVAEELDVVHNYFFDAYIREGELYFDYQFKPGVCSNMNASFLLRKLGVVGEEPGEA